MLLLALLLAATPPTDAPKKQTKAQREYSAKMKKKRARMEKMCKSRGPTCHVQGDKPGEPRDLMGVQCVCD